MGLPGAPSVRATTRVYAPAPDAVAVYGPEAAGAVCVADTSEPASAPPVIPSSALRSSMYVALGAAGATVSFGAEAVFAAETLPAASATVTEIVTVPSGMVKASIPPTRNVPPPLGAGAVFVTDATPFERTTRTVSDASELPGSVTDTETEERLARLIHWLPCPVPLASRTALGSTGGVASARAPACGLSTLSSAGAPVDTARTAYEYCVPSTVAVSE